ncbi:hypothetical protein MKQ68_12000 [Chitinophaga horti]|uniref:Thioredoxin domain-containing protein n=1 Tax=Chitinophaga horti TaxID=2920382 RepID=A0ABY6J804_9BACT|nr:hypothetical protein [Chitinophaga horti]UYQ95823.1 hypothetical protein MKQ68_12000 [Chitinophaga horti]
MRLLYLCLLFPIALFGQDAGIQIKTDGITRPLIVLRPVDGTFFPNNYTREAKPDEGKWIVSTDGMTAPGFFEVETARGMYYFYIRPGKRYRLELNTGTPFKLAAEDVEGQQLLQSFLRTAPGDVATMYLAKNRNFKYYKWKVTEDRDERLLPFKKLLRSEKISPEFYDAVDRLFTSYYACALTAIQVKLTEELVFDPKHADYDKEKIYRVGEEWKEILGFCNLNIAKNRVSRYFLDYCGLMNTYYFPTFGAGTTVRRDSLRFSDEYAMLEHSVKKGFVTMEQHFKDEQVQEYVLAAALLRLSERQVLPQLTLKVWDYYQERYPKSSYTRLLLPGMNAMAAKQPKPGKTEMPALPAGVDSVYSIADLQDRFKKDTVYVTFWNPDDAACHNALAYISEGQSVLKTKGIKMAFVCIDDQTSPLGVWKMADHFKLEGRHFWASATMVDALAKRYPVPEGQQVPEQEGLSAKVPVPRYLLIRNGRVLLGNAAALNQPENLQKQLDVLLDSSEAK